MPTPGDKSKVKTWKNAYVHFADKTRADLVKEHPTLDNTTISRELGRLWKALPTEERNVWVNLAAYDRARYIAECQIHATTALGTPSTAAAPQPTKAPMVDTSAEYDMSSSFSMLSPHPPSAPSHGATPASSFGDPLGQFSLPILDTTSPVAVSSSKKRKRESTGSQLQLAYYYFRRTKRDVVLAGNPTMLSADLNREIGRRWHALRPEERQPWMQMALANAKSSEASASALCPKLKDPLAPKAPRSAFQFLVESRRQEHPTMAYNALTKESAQLWRAMPDDRKAPWVKLACEDRLRYEGEMKNYKPPSYARDVGGAAKCADPGKDDKKPLSAYAHFFRDKRVLHPGLTFIELTHELSRQWKAMSMEDKRPWVQRAVDDKAQRGPPPTAPPSNRKKPTHGPVAPPSPPPRKESSIPRRPKSAFVHFQLETRPSMPDMPYKDFMQKIAMMWKAKSDAEKMPWQDLAKQDLDRYTRACASASSSAAAPTAVAPDASPGPTNVRGGKSPVAAALRLRHGFACFVQAKKHDILAKTPHLTHNELLHEVGKLWRDMSPLDRQPWQDLLQDKKAPATPSAAPACPRPSPDTATQSLDSPAPVLVEDSQQHHLELMEGLWGEDVEGVTQHIFYEDDLAQSHHLSLPMMEDMDPMAHHPHSSDML